MNVSRYSQSPINDKDKTSHSIKSNSPIGKNPKKSKSEINIKKKSYLSNLDQELKSLKQKIQLSKGILSTIYSKVKKKESQYENQITQKDLYLHRAKKMVKDYKNLYQDGLKDIEKMIDRNRAQTSQRSQNLLSKTKFQELKRKANKSIQDGSVELQYSRNSHKKKKSQLKMQKQKLNEPVIHKMKKSHSAIYQDKTKYKFEKAKIQNQERNLQKKYSNAGKQFLKERQKDYKEKSAVQKLAQRRLIQQQQKSQLVDEKKSLYEIYRQRIQKRQKQQNSQKMSWIVEKLQQNISDLQMIRKKSQLKLSKYSPQSHNHSFTKIHKVQNVQLNDANKKHDKELRIQKLQKKEKQSSKEKWLELNKRKLQKIKEYASK